VLIFGGGLGENSVLTHNFWTSLWQFGGGKIFCCSLLNKNAPLPLLFWENLQSSLLPIKFLKFLFSIPKQRERERERERAIWNTLFLSLAFP